LVWLKHPPNATNIIYPWELNKITEGPDVMTIIKRCDVLNNESQVIMRACVFAAQ
jgi:hypothetical protein